jgi:hypothetical protein
MGAGKYLELLKGSLDSSDPLFTVDDYYLQLAVALVANGTSPEFARLLELATADGDSRATQFFSNLLERGASVTQGAADNTEAIAQNTANIAQNTLDIANRATFHSVKEYGAVGNGVANDIVAIQAAITAASAAGGGTVFFPRGTYLVSAELVVPDNVFLAGEGRVATTLKPSVNSITVIHHTGSHGGVRDLGVDNNGKSGISALRITPLDEAQTSTRVNQNYNTYQNLYLVGCAEGIVLQAGPSVSTAASGCWYNTFFSVHIYYCTRGIWLKDPPNANASSVNYTRFYGVRVGQNTNTGLQIDAGSGNEFHGVSFEGISVGTSPNTTPTAIWIKSASSNGASNQSNRFIGASDEPGSTRSLVNENAYSEFDGCHLSNELVLTAIPLIMTGGYGASVMPQISPAWLWQGNSQLAGYPNNTAVARGPLKFATPTDGIVGVTDASSPTAGYVGQIKPASAGPISITSSNTFFNLTTIVLEPGNWIVFAYMCGVPNGNTLCTGMDLGISTSSTPATFADKVFGDNWVESNMGNPYGGEASILAYPINITAGQGNQTYYIKGSITHTSTPRPNAYVKVIAIRIH